MSKAVKCPVCEGSGELPLVGEQCTVMQKPVCHGCNGKGWIEVGNEQKESWPAYLDSYGQIQSPYRIRELGRFYFTKQLC